MLIFWPRSVKFGGETWEGVTTVSIDREAMREVIEWSDNGPHVVFADAAEQKVTIKIVMEVERGGASTPRVGSSGTLEIVVGPNTAGGRRISAAAVVMKMTHDLTVKKGAVRMVELIGVSGDGEGDPISEVEE